MGDELVHKCFGSQDCHEKNHLCRIIIRHDLDLIRKIAKDAQYYCKNCGRAAHDKENLCNPSRI